MTEPAHPGDEFEVDRTRSPHDEMFAGDERHYLGVGRSAVACIRLVLALAGAGEPRRILDLPCGHGRVLRALRAAWPAAEITACDLVRDGVDFCARTFGARPVYSDFDPARVPLAPRSFDLVWVGSLLTHLDRPAWSAFLDSFHRWLEPQGLLVFSTLGRYGAYRMEQGIDYGLAPETRAALLVELARAGFAYHDYPGQSGYGIALATPAFVTRELSADPRWRLVTYSEMLWNEHHDLIALQRVS